MINSVCGGIDGGVFDGGVDDGDVIVGAGLKPAPTTRQPVPTTRQPAPTTRQPAPTTPISAPKIPPDPAISVSISPNSAIPVPLFFSEQKRIVAILDKFDALINDLSVGLPVELNARRKQYEYYRDKFLTFQEKQ